MPYLQVLPQHADRELHPRRHVATVTQFVVLQGAPQADWRCCALEMKKLWQPVSWVFCCALRLRRHISAV